MAKLDTTLAAAPALNLRTPEARPTGAESGPETGRGTGRGTGRWPARWAMLRRRLRASWQVQELVLLPGVLPAGADAFDASGVLQACATQAAQQAFAAWCEAHAGARLRLALSAHWVWATLDPLAAPAAVAGAADAADGGGAVARVREAWAEGLGVATEALDEAWLWRALPERGMPLVCALPKAWLQTLQQAAATHHVQLDWVGPWWLAAAQAWWQEAAGAAGIQQLHLVEPGLCTVLALDAAAETAPDRPVSPRALQLWSQRTDDPAQADATSVPGAAALNGNARVTVVRMQAQAIQPCLGSLACA